jgi:hypothetical protein
MDRRILAIVLALVAVAVAVGIGTQLYQAGVARGLAESGQITPRPEGVPPYGYYRPYGYHPFGFGFGFFGFLFPLLFFFLIFSLFKGFFWRPWGWYGPSKYGVPPAVEEWHRKAHESQQQGQKM